MIKINYVKDLYTDWNLCDEYFRFMGKLVYNKYNLHRIKREKWVFDIESKKFITENLHSLKTLYMLNANDENIT